MSIRHIESGQKINQLMMTEGEFEEVNMPGVKRIKINWEVDEMGKVVIFIIFAKVPMN